MTADDHSLSEENLVRVDVKRVAGPIEGAGAAVFLGNETKTFVIFVGLFEASAIVKEMHSQKSARPLTHDLLGTVFLGFDIEVRRVVISEIIENTFCATLILEQKVSDENSEWVGKRNEVRLDARASDSIVIALKAQCPLHVTRQVFDQVEDLSAQLQPGGETGENLDIGELDLGDLDFDLSLGEESEDEDDD